MTKRRKFVLISLILSLGLLAIQAIQVEFRYQALVVLSLLAFGMSAWALYEDLNGVEWFSILILPTLYPVSVGLFYFLLPERLLLNWNQPKKSP